MSNPAVITLVDAGGKCGKFKRFVLEDNIGEAVHLHVDNIRIDFSINEFFEFSKMIRDSLRNLDFLDGYSIDSFDENFLFECSRYFGGLKSISIEELKIDELKFIVNRKNKLGFKWQEVVPVDQTPAYKFLQGERDDFLSYEQKNYFSVTNDTRLFDVLSSLRDNGYPLMKKYIVLFNGENLVRDGQHRLASLAHLYGLDCMVKVMRFNFSGRQHLAGICNNNIRHVSGWFGRKVYKKLKSFKRNLL